MRVTCTKVFGATFLTAWICLVWFGDFNTYVTGDVGQPILLDDWEVLGVMLSCVVALAVGLWAALAYWLGRLFWTTLRKRAV
jgi:hypothetical protein